jgi:hypothetical protein
VRESGTFVRESGTCLKRRCTRSEGEMSIDEVRWSGVREVE